MSGTPQHSNRASWIVIGVVLALAAVLFGIVTLVNSIAPEPRPSARRGTAAQAAPGAGAKSPESDPRRMTGAVFTADASNGLPPQFSRGQVVTTAPGRPYLGQYREDGVDFTLPGLPPHKLIHLTVDLALTKSWNGSNRIWGPDMWFAEVGNGGPLLHRATFSNCGFFNDNNEQTYPDTFPQSTDVAPHPAWTGAAEKMTLNSIQSWGGPSRTFDCSGVYKLDWTFPHAETDLLITFASRQKIKHDKVFGIMSIRVEPLPELVAMSDSDFSAAWEAMKGAEPVAANEAVWKMIATGDQATAFIKTRLDAGPAVIESADPYFVSRIKHVLDVVHSDAARQVRAKLPPDREDPI